MNKTKLLYQAGLAGSVLLSVAAAVVALAGPLEWAVALLALASGASAARSHLRMRMLSTGRRRDQARDAARIAAVLEELKRDGSTSSSIAAAGDRLEERIAELETVIASSESVIMAELLTGRRDAPQARR